jgi:5-methylcytosine-specific restriction endonuclease McrA
MPITDKTRYSPDWPEIRSRILKRADYKCEWCGAQNYKTHPDTGAKVVLTIAHMDHTPEHNEEWNLRALCQRCHCRYDSPFRQQNILIRRLQKENDDIMTKLIEIGTKYLKLKQKYDQHVGREKNE